VIALQWFAIHGARSHHDVLMEELASVKVSNKLGIRIREHHEDAALVQAYHEIPQTHLIGLSEVLLSVFCEGYLAGRMVRRIEVDKVPGLDQGFDFQEVAEQNVGVL
jgi:hypothetical protein